MIKHHRMDDGLICFMSLKRLLLYQAMIRRNEPENGE